MLITKGKRVLVEIWLSPSDQIVLDRYRSTINASIDRDKRLLMKIGYEPKLDPWNEELCIATLINSALAREHKFQMIQDNRPNDPPWIAAIVREAMDEIKDAS